MKTLLVLLIFTFASLSSVAGPVIADIAVEGYPGENVINGRYSYVTTDGGYQKFSVKRSDRNIDYPLTISWDNLNRRWTLMGSKIVSGASTRVLLATSYVVSFTPPLKGWYVYYPYGNPLGAVTPLTVYSTVTQTANCNECNWSNSSTWSSGFLPRSWDNVVINGRVLLDVTGRCNDLKINSVVYPATGKQLTGRWADSNIRMNGDLDVGASGRMDIFELEFKGNTRQTLKVNTERGFGVNTIRAIVNNVAGIQLLSVFGFSSRPEAGLCETRLVKGKVILGDYNLTCQTITGHSSERYFVTNGSGYLYLPANNRGTRYDKFFPIGSSLTSYTPLRMMNTSTTWEVQLAARARYEPSLFPATPHVNVIYNTLTNYVIPGSDSPLWIHTASWSAADESAGFNHSLPIRVDRYSDAGWARTGSEGIPTGTGPYSYSYLSDRRENFAIFQASSFTTRLAAEDTEPGSKPHSDDIEYGIFPNPATGSGFKVKVENSSEATTRLISLSGMTLNINTNAESSNIVAITPLESLPPGIYILQVKEKNVVRSHKVLIK